MGLPYSFVIPNNYIGSYILLNQEQNFKDDVFASETCNRLTISVFDDIDVLHSFSNEFLLILEVC